MTDDPTTAADFFELFVAIGLDLFVAPFELFLWGDEPDGRVQAGRVVIVDEVASDPLGLLDIKRREGANGLILQGLVEALKFAVGLRVVGAGVCATGPSPRRRSGGRDGRIRSCLLPWSARCARP